MSHPLKNPYALIPDTGVFSCLMMGHMAHSSSWVAWILPREVGGYLDEPQKRYVKQMVPEVILTKYRGSAARFETEEKALAAADMVARPGVDRGAEEIPGR